MNRMQRLVGLLPAGTTLQILAQDQVAHAARGRDRRHYRTLWIAKTFWSVDARRPAAALRRVRRRTSGTRLWTCDAGRAGTRIRSEALHYDQSNLRYVGHTGTGF